MEGSDMRRSTGGGEFPAAGSGFREEEPLPATGSEFNLIGEFLRGIPRSRLPDIRVGAGDDCAVVAGDGIVLGTDLCVEDVHFRRSWLTGEEIGYRAAAAALSDLAAMAARPIGVLASLGVAARDADTLAAEVMRGVRAAVEAFGGQLLGGDLTRSPGPLILDLVGVGESGTPVLRTGATPGDEIWVTGALGGAGAAVSAWMAGGQPEPDARNAFANPVPRIREALWLASRGLPRAMLDLSDGIGGDLGHLATMSNVAVVLDAQAIPVHAAARQTDDPLGFALNGGEDYELCFAARPGDTELFHEEFVKTFHLPLTRVGRVEAGRGVYIILPDGGRKELNGMGFQHFGDEG
ncbi:MAG: thiamine-phosphate kinase [Gemmatimonadota bacterium]|jgi:thiamine-monophosphate kinase|nr:thiamine-phosphate kinase [Gemmatimonadota bacterium]